MNSKISEKDISSLLFKCSFFLEVPTHLFLEVWFSVPRGSWTWRFFSWFSVPGGPWFSVSGGPRSFVPRGPLPSNPIDFWSSVTKGSWTPVPIPLFLVLCFYISVPYLLFHGFLVPRSLFLNLCILCMWFEACFFKDLICIKSCVCVYFSALFNV